MSLLKRILFSILVTHHRTRTMEINILFTLHIIVILLGGLFFQGAKLCPKGGVQIDLCSSLSCRAVKLVMKGSYLLNNVVVSNAPKATQITLIPLQNIKLKG